jgi:hypothetical protein
MKGIQIVSVFITNPLFYPIWWLIGSWSIWLLLRLTPRWPSLPIMLIYSVSVLIAFVKSLRIFEACFLIEICAPDFALVSCRGFLLVRRCVFADELDFKPRTCKEPGSNTVMILVRRSGRVGFNTRRTRVAINQNKYSNQNNQSGCRSWDSSLCSSFRTSRGRSGRRCIFVFHPTGQALRGNCQILRFSPDLVFLPR